MALEQLYYVSQIIAVALILGSLIAIFLQQKRTNEIVRTDMVQRAGAEYSNILKEVMVNPQLAKAFRKVMFEREELTPVEATQILTYFNLAVGSHASAYRFVKLNMMDIGFIEENDRNIAWYLTAPIFAREWSRVQDIGSIGQEFALHMNRCFSELYPSHEHSTIKRSAGLDT